MTTTVLDTQVPVCVVDDVGGFVYDTSVRVLFAETLTSPSGPTREDFDYAIDTTDLYCLVGMSAWEMIGETIVDPPWGMFDAARIGRLRMRRTPSVLTYAADRFGRDIREVFSRGVRGWILILPSGDLPGAVMNVFPVWVTSATPRNRLREEGAQVDVRFAVTARPHTEVTVPPGAGNVTWNGASATWDGQEVDWT